MVHHENTHTEGVCPRCDQETNISLTQEISHIENIPTLTGPYESDETLLLTVRCVCGYEGYARFPLGNFAGYITQEEIEQREEAAEELEKDFMKQVKAGKVCFGCNNPLSVDGKCGSCMPYRPTRKWE